MRAALTLALAALALSGCTKTIDDAKVERHLSKLAKDGGGVDVRSVGCPSGVVAKKGGTFTCKLVAEDGSSVNLEVDIENSDGDLTFPQPNLLDQRDVESKLQDAVSQRSGYTDVTAKCPELIPGDANKTARCEVTGGGHSGRLTIYMTDDQGDFRILGQLQ